LAIIASNADAEKMQQAQPGEKKEADLGRKEDGETMSSLTVKLTRKELYEEIWKLSVAGVARKYDIPYVKCLAQIKAVQIPVPPSGYWTKINFGKQVEQMPLPGDGDAIVTLQKDNFQEPNIAKSEQVVQTTSLRERTESVSPNASTPMDPIPQSTAEKATNQVPPETVQRFGQTYNVYNRETLYREVWNMPVAEVAKRYKVSDVAIHKVCKSLNIPTPPQGYWAKLRAGKPVKKPSLPPGGESKKMGMQTGAGTSNRSNETEIPLEFLPEEERQVVLNVAAQILLPQENDRMLPEIVAHRKKIVEWSKRKRQQEREFGAGWNRGRNQEPAPLFAEGVSEEQQSRVFRLIDALAKAMTPLGWELTADLKFATGQDSVTLMFSESTDKVLHTPTKEENLKLLQYEEERKKHSWASKPQIRKYDAVYNGRLGVSINGARTFRDCRSYVLEERLGDMMLAIYEEAERVKQARLDREEAERQRREQERKREEHRKLYNAEVDRTLALVNCAEDYETACRIRSYVSAMEKAHPEQELSEWASWARAKADWYDPTIAKEDELLGKREHEKKQKDKEPDHKGYWW
jgi:hypothetical protein